MKRYIVFISEGFYPRGGMRDFHGDYDSIEECHEHIKCNDYHIFDCELKQVVFDKELYDIEDVYGERYNDPLYPRLKKIYPKELWRNM